jgi:hypothetical protein
MTIPSILLGFINPAGPGQSAYTTAGTFTFVVPQGITSISVVAVGGGGGGARGGNNSRPHKLL